MSPTPDLSVVIPNWNGNPFLFELFVSLFQQDGGQSLQIVLVDNASEDGSLEMIRSFYPDVDLVPLTVNQGFAAAVNRGIHQSRARYIAVLNNDLCWNDTWLTTCRKFLDTHPEYDFVAPLVLNYFDRERVDSAGDQVNLFLMPHKMGFGLSRDQISLERRDLLAASCSAVVFRRSFFDRVGGFDEDFFMYYEDIDLFFRGMLKGCRGRLLPDQVVFHREGGSIDRYEAQPVDLRQGLTKHRLLIRNRILFLVKNCPGAYLGLAAPLLVAELVRTFGHHLLHGRGKLFLSAHREALRFLPWFRIKRQIVQKNRCLGLRRLIAWLATPDSKPCQSDSAS